MLDTFTHSVIYDIQYGSANIEFNDIDNRDVQTCASTDKFRIPEIRYSSEIKIINKNKAVKSENLKGVENVKWDVMQTCL